MYTCMRIYMYICICICVCIYILFVPAASLAMGSCGPHVRCLIHIGASARDHVPETECVPLLEK